MNRHIDKPPIDDQQRRAADARARREALNVSRSFIVQAPAGSGKTELLTQRFLALLAVVEQPEHILAMTFTRKAAGEMRARILRQLQEAADTPFDDTWPEHRQTTWQLAYRALQRDAEAGWHVLEHPARLRIQTIDAFCAALAAQMPYLSRLGGMARTSEAPEALYQEAASGVLQALNDDHGDTALADALCHVLDCLDNRRSRLHDLLVQMLARREQWLRHLLSGHDPADWQASLHHTLSELADTEFQQFAENFSLLELHGTEPLFDYACEFLDSIDDAGLREAIPQWPAAEALHDPETVLPWLRGLSQWLLTQKGTVLAKVDKRHGFPTEEDWPNRDAKAQKAAFTDVLNSLREQPDFAEALLRIRDLPALKLPDAEWRLLNDLRRVLLQAVAELDLVFRRQGELDFSQVQMAALQALGDSEEPTDLALRKDRQIQHLLVDEFQDTSHAQFELLRRLTREWQPDEGRSLFLVGDPMQSIYRFRESDVGLFLRVREQGFGAAGEGGLQPDFLELNANFRSDAGLVDWVNTQFGQVFPPQEDRLRGAIPHAPATAARAANEARPVCLHAFEDDDGSAEAQAVVALVRDILEQHPDEDIAILGRARGHLSRIAEALQRAGLRFQAVDVQPLSDRQVSEDLLALTRALLHPADREAWLALLRAPWCGLRLNELAALMDGVSPHTPVLECLHNIRAEQALCSDSRLRLAHVTNTLQQAVLARSRHSLRRCVEDAWAALGGPAVLLENSDFDDAQAFFALLERLQRDSDDIAADLDAGLKTLYAAPDTGADGRLKLMTIHASKGLEFGTVILPGLNRKPAGDSERLLYWQEVSLDEGDALLIAPIDKAATDETEGGSGLCAYLKSFEKDKNRFETQRLLYVAVTRARQRLHLMGSLGRSSKGEIKAPISNGLLAPLWPALGDAFTQALSALPAAAASKTAEVLHPPRLARLKSDWTQPALPAELLLPPPQSSLLRPPQQDVPVARISGILLHACLQRIHDDGVEHWHGERLQHLENLLRPRLRGFGLSNKEQAQALRTVENALTRMLADERGRWLLDNRHTDSHAELELFHLETDATTTHIIDRCFIADGERWIVDYKTAQPARNSSLNTFLERQKNQHGRQLERYARLFAEQESLPIRLMLYFPLIGEGIDWLWER